MRLIFKVEISAIKAFELTCSGRFTCCIFSFKFVEYIGCTSCSQIFSQIMPQQNTDFDSIAEHCGSSVSDKSEIKMYNESICPGKKMEIFS